MRLPVALCLLACATLAAAQADLPATPKRPVVDTYFGIQVTDNYRWLENGASPEVKQWVAAEDAHTAAWMDKLPQRNAILAYLRQRMHDEHTVYTSFEVRQGRLFALRYDPGKAGPSLVTFTSPEAMSSERTILDTTTFVPGKVFQVDWYSVSPDGGRVGLALSTGGSEDGSLFVVDTATGRPIGETVPRVQFATGGGAMAWNADGTGFYYTRYPQGNERPAADRNFYQQVYFHQMGTEPASDLYVLGRDFPRIAETTFIAAPDFRQTIVNVANGDGGDYESYLLDAQGTPHAITSFADKIDLVTFGPDDSLWLLSHKNSDRGELWHLPAGDLRVADAKLVVAAGDASLEGSGYDPNRVFVASDKVYVTVINGGPEEIRAYTLSGRRLPSVAVPPVASVGSLVRDGSNAFLFSAETYTAPEQWYRYDGQGTPQTLPFHTVEGVSLADIDVQRVLATSRDGTRVPMTILMRKGTPLDGTHPALITGYGGFDISLSPSFAGSRFWFDHGGILAIANLRGGGEYGEAWHKAGSLTHKQNVFDDFAACAQYLVDHHYTSPAHLAAEGGSNGGLLMGAMISQHPHLFRAVLTYVGIYDMLRTELDPNGTFNVTEYGTVKNPEQFKALYAYSPYQHVTPGTAYPAVLLITGDNDHRVNPAHSRKMTAILQADSTSGRPILLLTNANAGHGISTNVDEALLEEADAQAFLFEELGMTAQ